MKRLRNPRTGIDQGDAMVFAEFEDGSAVLLLRLPILNVFKLLLKSLFGCSIVHYVNNHSAVISIYFLTQQVCCVQ